MTMVETQSFRTREKIESVVVSTGVRICRDGKLLQELDYPEAAIWDFASRNYSFGKICFLMSHVAPGSESNRLVARVLTSWVGRGYLEPNDLVVEVG